MKYGERFYRNAADLLCLRYYGKQDSLQYCSEDLKSSDKMDTGKVKRCERDRVLH